MIHASNCLSGFSPPKTLLERASVSPPAFKGPWLGEGGLPGKSSALDRGSQRSWEGCLWVSLSTPGGRGIK